MLTRAPIMTAGREEAALEGAREPERRPRFPRVQLAVGSLGFVGLTVAVFWYQFARVPGDAPALAWSSLHWRVLPLLLLCLPVESVASALRIWLLCRVLEPRVGLWTCFKAEWANVAIAMLTPSQSGGGPGQIYMLSRGGVRVGTALTVSLLSFLGTMIGLFVMGLYSLLVSGIGATGPLFAGAVWSLTGIAAVMAVAAGWPDPIRIALAAASRALWRMGPRRRALREWWPPDTAPTARPVDRMGPLTARLVDLVYAYRDDVARFLRLGTAHFVGVCLLSLVFLFARALMPYLCLRFLGLETAGLRHVLDLQIALVFLVFFAPTPGGAGIAEAASLSVMADVVPAAVAPYYTLLWRVVTLYLAALAGLVCLLQALLADARRALASRR
jgi:glycosyltransferase 2 family protein